MTTIAIRDGWTTASAITASTSTRLRQVLDHAKRACRRAATRRQLRALGPDQLRDAGIDPSEVSSGPVLHVDVGTMTNLMSMR